MWVGVGGLSCRATSIVGIVRYFVVICGFGKGCCVIARRDVDMLQSVGQ